MVCHYNENFLCTKIMCNCVYIFLYIILPKWYITLQKKEVWDQLFCLAKCFKIFHIYRNENPSTLCSQFMRFRIMRFSIYAVLENGPNSCFMLQYSHIMRFLVKIIVYKILLIFFLHLCYSCIMRFFLGNKKRINGELSV